MQTICKAEGTELLRAVYMQRNYENPERINKTGGWVLKESWEEGRGKYIVMACSFLLSNLDFYY